MKNLTPLTPQAPLFIFLKLTPSKKHLNFTALRQALSMHLLAIDDQRVEGRCTHTLHDAFMSAFACMFFQDPSLNHFQQRMQKEFNNNNLRTLLAVDTIPKNSQLRDVIDPIPSSVLRPAFKDYFERLRRSKQLESFQVLPGQYLCAIDGVYHHSSAHVHCDKCLTQTHKNGSITYHHAVLQAVFFKVVDPAASRVIHTRVG